MASHPVRIGYYDPFNTYQAVQNELQHKFPLTNLHWKYNSLKPVKSIPVLPVELVEEIPKSSATTDSSVYLRLMFVTYDSLELYRLQVRPLIKEWLKKLVVTSLVEWMILFVMPSGSKDKLSTIIKTSLFDKLKIDFDTSGKELSELSIEPGTERCIKLRQKYESDFAKTESYTELISQIKSMLLNTFDSKHQQYNDMLLTYNQNHMSSLLAKVQLARLFYHMRLLEDSLAIYDDLYSAINILIPTNKSAFTESFDISVDLNNFNIDTLGVKDVSSFDPDKLLQSPPVNVFCLKSLVFSAQTQILRALASSSSPSLSIAHVGVMLKRLSRFLNDVSLDALCDVNEWMFAVIDLFTNLDTYVSADKFLTASTDDEIKLLSTDFYNSRAELVLLQRSALIAIASKNGFSIKGLDDVLHQHFQDISLDDDTKPRNNPPFSYPRLKEILKDTASYYNYFEQVTEFIIQDLVVCGREKTIDMLSIDLAFLNYHKGNYEAAIDIIHNSYQYFIESGWTFLGGVLLEVYLHCILKVNPDNHVMLLDICLKLLASIPSSSTSGKVVGINSYQLIKKKPQIKGLFEKMIDCSLHLSETVEYPLQTFFTTKISSYILADFESSLDRYFVELKVTNLLGIPITWSSVAIEFQTSGENITFLRKNVTLTNEREQTIKVYSNNFRRGYLSPKQIIVNLSEKLQFCEKLSRDGDGDDDFNQTVLKFTNGSFTQAATLLQAPQAEPNLLLMYRNLNKFWCEFRQPSLLVLGSNAIELEIHNGDNDLLKLDITVTFGSDDVKFDNHGRAFRQQTELLNRKEVKRIPVKYFYTGDSLKLNVSAQISYTVNGETFQYFMDDDIDRSLAVSVTVLDIFRESFFYSKFQVGTSNAKFPIRIKDVTLTSDSTNFDIQVPSKSYDSVVAFGEQPVSYLYRILPTATYRNFQVEKFDLKVTYSDIRSECLLSLQKRLIGEFKSLKLDHYWFLIHSILQDSLRFDLNHYAIYREVKVLNHNETLLFAAKMANKYVPFEHLQQQLVKVIGDVISDQWLEPEEPGDELRELRIAVPAPSLDVLHSATFEYERKSQYLVGEPIEIKLTINTISLWALEKSGLENEEILASSSPKRGEPVKKKHSFQASLLYDENWLMSGFKREIFEVDYSTGFSENDFSLVLIPLNVGKLELPKIGIKSASAQEQEISMDTILKNGSETLLVVPEVSSITFTF